MRLLFLFSFLCSMLAYSQLPAQAKEDIAVFNSGHVIAYSSKDDGKNISDHFTISYLPGWEKTSRTGNIVKRFSRQIGSATASYSVTVVKIDHVKTEAEIDADLKWMAAALPRNYNLISNSTGQTISGLKAALTEYYFDDVNAAGQKVRLFFCTYSFFSKNSFIQIQCSVGDREDNSSLKELFETYKPFFKSIAGSLKLNAG